MTLPGIDVASFQDAPGRWMPLAGKISWAAVKVSELSSAGSYVDPDALTDLAALKAKGLGRVCYLFGHPAMSASASVGLFLSTIEPVLTADDAVALDHEVTDGLSSAQVAAWGRDVLTTLEQRTHRKPVLYTFRDFALAGYCAGMGGYPLWIADPDHPAGKPQVPAPWTSWAIHQFASSPLDRDCANYPSLAAMRAALGRRSPKAALGEDDMPFLMSQGTGAVTPVSIAAGRTHLILTPADTATVGVQFLDHGITNYPLAKQPNGGTEVPIPSGCQHAWLHMVESTGGVSVAVE